MQVSSFSMVLIIGFDRAKENLHLNSKDLNTNYNSSSHFVIQEALGIVLTSTCFRTLCGLPKELWSTLHWFVQVRGPIQKLNLNIK